MIIRTATTVASPVPAPAPPHVFEIRAPQAGASLSTVSINTSPFFPEPSTLVPPVTQQTNQNNSGLFAKSILEYLFLSIAILIVGSMVIRRMIKLRKANKPISTFFSAIPPRSRSRTPIPPRVFPRTTGLPPISATDSPLYPFYHSSYLSNVPAVYIGPTHERQRRVHALDTDEGGRRLDTQHELDHDGVLEDKDVLPAYDNVGGPPKYDESEILTRILAVRSGGYRRMEERVPVPGATEAPAYSQVIGAAENTRVSNPPPHVAHESSPPTATGDSSP